MIPLRDSVPSRRTPFVNYAILLANALLFAYELSLAPGELERFLQQSALVPARFFWGIANEPLHLELTLIPLVFSMFLHGGWAHLLGNMLYLYIFGDNVEDRLGHVKYLLMYLATGAAAALSQLAASPASSIPMLGASGAIGGVMGAYFLFYPRARVLTLLPIFVFFYFVEVPAVLFLLFWFLLQFLQGSLALTQSLASETGGVAWWAHIGGFVAGAGIALLAGPRRRPRRVDPDAYER